MTTATLGQFVLDTARSPEKQRQMPDHQAREVRNQLSKQVAEKVEELRALQRRAYENSKSITVF